MTPFKNLAHVVTEAAGGLDLIQLRRLIWCWQAVVLVGEDRIAGDSVARLLDGQPVPERDEMIAYAAVIAVLPTAVDKPALDRAFFRDDKVLNIPAAYGSLCRMSPWRFVRLWAAEDLADFARALGLERRSLRRLEEAPWTGGTVSDTLLGALADLGRWLACNAVGLDVFDDLGDGDEQEDHRELDAREELEDLDGPCGLAAAA